MDMETSEKHLDIDDESVLTSVLKGNISEGWKDDPEFVNYLAKLSSYGVEKLNREPAHLAEEKSHVLEQTQDLAFHNYKTFIKTAECSKNIFQDFSVVEEKLDAMITKLPNLSEKAKKFMQASQEIATSRRANSLLLMKNTKILEVLEIPQLMDTCVRNQYYDEALELMFYVKRMERKNMSEIPVLESIIRDVKSSSQLMLSNLLAQLRTNIQLPACLRIIGYLRRLDCFSEMQLRLKFLQARNTWLESMLNNIPSDDPYTHITKNIEICRINLFDIVTQYRAIFSDDSDLTSPFTNESADKPSERSIFQCWLVNRISIFLDNLENDLARGIGSKLDSVLGQCMYFGLSFSRVGADFRGLLCPIFIEAAHSTFKQAVEAANQEFATDMMSFSLVSSNLAYNQSLNDSLSASISNSSYSSPTPSPPLSLLMFPPLAVYLNNILAAFNDLRLCCPVALSTTVPFTLTESLQSVVADILGFYHTEESAFSEKEKLSFTSFCSVFHKDLLDFLNECLLLLFPPTVLADNIGMNAAQFKAHYGMIGKLNINEITEPLSKFLPKPEEKTVEGDVLTDNVAVQNNNIENGLTMNDLKIRDINDDKREQLNTETKRTDENDKQELEVDEKQESESNQILEETSTP